LHADDADFKDLRRFIIAYVSVYKRKKSAIICVLSASSACKKNQNMTVRGIISLVMGISNFWYMKEQQELPEFIQGLATKKVKVSQ